MVKSHAGIAGNENADRKAKHQTSLRDKNLIDNGIPSAVPGGNPLYSIAWLAREEARPRTPESSSPIPNLVYFPNLKDALKSHLQAKHRLGYADCKTGYSLNTRACYFMQIWAFAIHSGTCPVSQPE
eukprot:694288-Pelagomonas_calceolata.AAC.1